MAKKYIPKIKADAKAVAKVEASVKALYQYKKSITEVVPEDVTRANASAWLDLISPITQWAGLKGDRLKNKRQLLRLQQEDALQAIVEDAMARLPRESGPISPLPNKFLVPFLERASLEEEHGSDLSKLWSDLLISAATNYSPSMVRFTSVLSEIGAGEVRLLKKMVSEGRSARDLNHLEDVPNIFIHGVLQRMVELEVPPSSTPDELHDHILRHFEYPGTAWAFIGIWEGDDYFDFKPRWFSKKDEEIASNLVSLGVLHLIDGLEGTIGNFGWNGRVYALTSFGFRFLLACDSQIRSELETIIRTAEERELASERMPRAE